MKRILTFLIPSVFFIIGCKDSDNPVSHADTSGKITIGDVVNLTTQSIGTGGGIIKVIKSSDPLDGLEVTIPPNSYNQSKSFQISYAPIIKHQLGENFNPISPMIKISNDGSFAEHALKIRIPIKLPANHFATGFFYNENSQTLEPIPTIELTDSTITLKTQSLPSNKKLAKSTDDVQTNLIISSIIESALDNGAVLSTGFEPGFDDWEFLNSGSYAEPGGHCAGQSMSAVYYFYEKKLKENADPLYHKFDVVNDKSTLPPKLWQDNPRGYRLASVMQHQMAGESASYSPELVEHFTNPTLVWKLFVHGIKVTGAPQIIDVQSSSLQVGHAMIVYKVNLSEKKLYIADPNFPTSIRTIAFQNGKLGPYNTKTKDGEPEYLFEQVGFLGVSAMVPWKNLTDSYTQFEAGTIGNDIFPSYKLYVGNTSGSELTDGMTITSSTLKIVCKSDKCDLIIGNTDKLQPITIYNEDGIQTADVDNNGVASINLNQGANKIGIYIQGLKSDVKKYYIDFKWITVNYTPSTQPKLIITPNPLEGLKNKKYKFVAALEGAALPAKPKYFWGMDAHGTTITVYNNDTLEYKYKDTGTYPIQVSLYDSVTGIPIAYGSSQAKIREAANNFEYMITSWLLYFSFYADMKFNPANAVAGEFKINTDYYFKGQKDLTWDGNYFSVDYKYGVPPISTTGDTLFVTGSFIGRISSDGSLITSFTATEHQQAANGYVRDQSIDISGVQINNCSPNGCSAVHEGSQVKGYITNISISGSYKDSGQTINYSLISVDYNSSNKPKLSISFVR